MRRLWNAAPALTATAVLMLVALGAAIVGLLADPRVVAGAPAWLKPAKFAASVAIYSVTLAWIFTLLPAWIRMRRIIDRTSAAVLVLEVALISLQAWRGTTSHFNVATAFDAVVFGVMGAAIFMQTLSTVAVAVALWRQEFSDRALGWALRFGMAITIVGAASGGLMSRPTHEQLDAARVTGRIAVAGAHTVGAPDGGPGLPGAGWSTTHGDLRVPHFVGLHAVQLLPLLALVLARGSVRGATRTWLVVTASLSYAALFAILLSQALGGHSVAAPDRQTLTLLTAWAIVTAAAAALGLRPPRHHASEAA